jgi:large subunit ribosomal protein L10
MSGGAMPRAEKFERVTALKERIEGSDALLLADYRGLTVSEITSLRRSLSEGGTTFAVVKNTLMQRAAAEAGIEGLEAMLLGPSAVAFVGGDPVAAAKRVVAAAKDHPTLTLKGAYLDGQVLSADQARSLADLESRETMLSKVAGMLQAEMSRAAAMFQGAQSRFLLVLAAYRGQLPDEEPQAQEPQAEEPQAEEPQAEEPQAEEPQAKEPQAEEPQAEEPQAEEPQAEEPQAKEPQAEEQSSAPEAEEHAAEEPQAIEEPQAAEDENDERE